MTVQVLLNGQRRELEPDATLASVVASLPGTPQGRGLAVALDGEVVPRGQWDQTQVREGARIEIVAAVQGG